MTFKQLVREVERRTPPGRYFSVVVEYNGFSSGPKVRWAIYDEAQGHKYGNTPEDVLTAFFPTQTEPMIQAALVDADQEVVGG